MRTRRTIVDRYSLARQLLTGLLANSEVMQTDIYNELNHVDREAVVKIAFEVADEFKKQVRQREVDIPADHSMTFERKMEIMMSAEVEDLVLFVTNFDGWSHDYIHKTDSKYILMLKRLADHYSAMIEKQKTETDGEASK